MKKLILFTILLSTIGIAKSQNNIDGDGVLKALKTLNSSALVSYFDEFVDVKLPGKAENKDMSKNQAGVTINDFFSDHKFKSFDLVSQREMSGTMYIAGKLSTDDGGYNITIMMKAKGDKLQIITIRIS